jgi:hypothetical protein
LASPASAQFPNGRFCALPHALSKLGFPAVLCVLLHAKRAIQKPSIRHFPAMRNAKLGAMFENARKRKRHAGDLRHTR